ncbi:MAG: hypothetical protein AAGA01_17795, partial [Cyanobacteria bacterium P01_E01_bin.43]
VISYQTYDRMSILGLMTPQALAEKVSQIAAQPLIERNEASLAGVDKEGDLLSSALNLSAGVTQPIEVRARQWSWEFYYSEADVSSTELHLPVNQRARFTLISEDVLHGFYVPAFRVKQDLIPGKEIDFAFTPIKEGRYRLRDSDYSGTYFAANQTYVVVESLEAYQQWLADAAANPLAPAPNLAYEEFQKVEKQSTGFRWKTIEPAPAPVVNYASPERDRSSVEQTPEKDFLEPRPLNPDLLNVQPFGS